MGIFYSCEKARRSRSKKAMTHDISERRRPAMRIIDGRTYHNEEDSSYPLPSDDREVDRLHEQYFITRELLGWDIMRDEHSFDYLNFEEKLEILDLCCGPATWLCEMCPKYQNCNFTGVDMTSNWPQLIRPANLKTIQANIIKGLPFPDKTFDFIQIRLVVLAFSTDQLQYVLSEVRRVLKVGGYFQWIDYDVTDTSLGEFTKKFGEYCSIVDIDPAVGSKINDLLPAHGMQIYQQQYCKIPLGYGRGCDLYLPVFREAMVGLTPIVRRTLLDEDVDLAELFDKGIQDDKDSNSVVHLYATLARKTSTD